MLEERPRILRADLRKRRPDRVRESLTNTRPGLSQQVLDLRERLSIGIETLGQILSSILVCQSHYAVATTSIGRYDAPPGREGETAGAVSLRSDGSFGSLLVTYCATPLGGRRRPLSMWAER